MKQGDIFGARIIRDVATDLAHLHDNLLGPFAPVNTDETPFQRAVRGTTSLKTTICNIGADIGLLINVRFFLTFQLSITLNQTLGSGCLRCFTARIPKRLLCPQRQKPGR